MSSQQPIPGSYKKPPFSSSPYGVTPPPIPNIPPRATGSPSNNQPRGSIVEGGGGSYIAAATSFRPKSFNPRAASAGTGSYFSAHSQGSLGDADNGNGSGLGEKRQIRKGSSGQSSNSATGVSALSKALEREGVAKATQDGDESSTNNLDIDRLAPPDRTPSPGSVPVPRIPTPTNVESRSGTPTQEPGATATPTDISEIPEEEKLRILRKHLVSAEERQQSSPVPGDGVSPGGSRTASIHAGQSTFSTPAPQAAGGSGISRASGTRTPDAGASGIARSIRDDAGEETNGDAFPIPYDAPGGDVT